MNAVVHALGLLTPFDIDIPKVRIGPAKDGGYILADNLRSSQTVVSYGISTEYGLDETLAARGHRVYMFDHTIDGIDAVDTNMRWFKEGVAGTSNPQRDLYTIEDHLRRHDIGGDDLVMQMDVEGAELDALGMAPDAVLGRFEQVSVEVHELHRLNEPTLRRRVVRMLTKLNRQFTLFHVHANNYVDGNRPCIVAGLPCVSVIELSYIRTSSVRRRPSATLYPTIYDRPNNPAVQDKKLWFFPFLPSRVPLDSYREDASRLAQQILAPQVDAEALDAVLDTSDCIDVAVGKRESQSSTSAAWTPVGAAGAVSGEISGTYSFHTEIEDQPWWQVDLGADYPIEGIVIYNRDCFPERAYHFVLKLADGTGDFTQVYERKGRPFGNRANPARIPLGRRPARCVRVQLEGHDFLHLDAVEVYVREALVDAVEMAAPADAP